MGARAGLHRPRRRTASPARVPRARARGGIWPGADQATRAHAPGPQGGQAQPDPSDQGEPLPIFSLFDDPAGAATEALARATSTQPWGQATDDDGTVNRVWRVTDPGAIAQITGAAAPAELLIADGHHRYETARVYADEIGGEGPHRYVLMCLVALEDPGLTVFPTHRLLRDLRPDQHETLADAIRRDFTIEKLESTGELAPTYGQPVRLGYIDAHFRQPYMLTLKDPAIAEAALADHAAPYRRLDTAVLEALILKGALQMTDDDIDHMAGLDYARDFDHALDLVQSGARDAAFFVAPTPIEEVRAVAAAGESMPPKSTYFFPKVPTGLLFNPLDS